MDTFELFNNGKLALPETMVDFADIAWSKHPTFEGVELVKGSGSCINADVMLSYEAGTISIMPAGVKHEVAAGLDGLYLFAKFLPALC